MGRLFLTETDNSTIFAEQRKARTRVGVRFFLCGFNIGEGLTVARENARNCLTRVRALKVRTECMGLREQSCRIDPEVLPVLFVQQTNNLIGLRLCLLCYLDQTFPHTVCRLSALECCKEFLREVLPQMELLRRL